METDAHIEGAEATATAILHGLRALWSRACEWTSWLFEFVTPARLRETGLTRTRGAQFAGWLMHVEAGVRRLILIAALAITPAARRPAAVQIAPRPAAATRRRPAFRVFCVHGTGATRPSTPGAARPERDYGHIVFPSDPLLRLGATRRIGMPRRIGSRRRNPLDRWVRLSRQDPDWRPPEELWKPPAGYEGIMSFVERAPAPIRERQPRAPRDPDAMPESAWDCRRRHDEWTKRVAAPQLAARLEALQRVTADPTRAIASTARRLHQAQHLARHHLRHAVPPQRYPNRAAHLDTGGPIANFPEDTHDALVRCDTS